MHFLGCKKCMTKGKSNKVVYCLVTIQLKGRGQSRNGFNLINFLVAFPTCTTCYIGLCTVEPLTNTVQCQTQEQSNSL